MAHRDVKQKLQADDGGIERNGRDALVHQMQLKESQIFGGGSVWRSTQILCKPAYRSDVGFLRLGRELAHTHILFHALA
jgi:hypothetical protein